MRLELRPVTALALLFAVVVAISGGSIVTAELGVGGVQSAQEIETVTLADDTEIWPYTSRAPTVEERTLAINLVVYADGNTAEQMLRASVVGEWEELDEDEQDIAPAEAFNETATAWGAAAGADRYVYVDPPEEEGRWLGESYQLKDGDYLGSRYHVRAYQDPSNNDWTAMQAHLEHWDWFHLRHTVHTIEEAQSHVESEYVDAWYVEDLRRERFGNDQGSDSDGWVTVVDFDDERISILFSSLSSVLLGLTAAPLLLGLAGATGLRSRTRKWWADESVQTAARVMTVVGSLVGLFLAIRFGAIGIERVTDGLSQKVVIAVFYPLLVAGLPVVAYLSARQLEDIPAFAAGAIGFALVTFFDYWYLGVTTLPLETFVHRAALAIAIGFIAAGASRTARSPMAQFGHVRTGVLLWLAAVVVPLLQFL